MQKYLCLCNPALLYVIFASVQIIFDLFNQMYTLAIIKAFITIIFTFFLNMLCANGLSIISWIIIIIPFFFTLLLVEILIFILGVNVVTNKIPETNTNENVNIIVKTNTNTNTNNRNYMDTSYSETPHFANDSHFADESHFADDSQFANDSHFADEM